ncbi:MAG TPA: FkbM family methyltransferase [Candidatus Paceibacterota bacterium]|nr:FkbM family methyltransferase [Candidatus Paceibacterota bacterium]
MIALSRIKSKVVEKLTPFGPFQYLQGKRWVGRWDRNYSLAEKELAPLAKALGKDSVVFDIGANRGELSYFFAKVCGAGKVFAFEPQSRMFGVLRGVASKVSDIIPQNIAFSDAAGDKELAIPVSTIGRYTQMASFEPSESASETESVHVDTVDAFVATRGIARLDLIKCDTEGHELSVFKGAEKTLASLRPILFIEVKGPNAAFLLSLLKERGYAEQPYDGSSENRFFFPVERQRDIIEKIRS